MSDESTVRSAGTAHPDIAPTPADLEAIAVDVAARAAEVVRFRLGSAVVFGTKSTATDVVTETDLEVETFIRTGLAEATPGASVLGEEDGSLAGSTSIEWVVDPIDGTVNFLYDLPVLSVSIAAKLDDNVVAGAVTDVVRREVFSGSVGNGVRRDGIPVAPSGAVDVGASLIGTGFSYDGEVRRREGEVVARLLPEARDIRCFGSAALHLCWVASGQLDGFYEYGLNEWDIAAGALLVREAGGLVEVPSVDSALTIAATPLVFEQLKLLVAM